MIRWTGSSDAKKNPKTVGQGRLVLYENNSKKGLKTLLVVFLIMSCVLLLMFRYYFYSTRLNSWMLS